MKRRLGSCFNTLRGGLAAASVLTLALTGCGGGGGGGGGGGAPPPAAADSGVVFEGGAGSAIELPANPTIDAGAIVALNAVLDLHNTASYANGKLSVHFFLKDEDGNGISLTKNSCDFRAYASQLITATGADDPGPGWHQVDNDSANGGELDMLPGLLTVIDGSAGEYSYTYADDGNSGRHEYAGGGIAAAMADPANILRATLVIRCSVEVDGETYLTVNPVNGSYDFSTADPATEIESGADIAATGACNTCHGPGIGGVGHGRYTEVKTCNNCHALDSYVSDQNADLGAAIHSIHSAQAGDAGPYVWGHDFAEVTYPQNLWSCAKCHADGTAVDKATDDGEDGPMAANYNLAYTNPTRRSCGGCHSGVDFATGEGHAAGPQSSDESCKFCHPATGAGLGGSVAGVHDLGPTGGDPRNQAEYDATIAMTPPANGEYYVAGETPVVTVTLASADGGPEVADYTAAADAKGDRDGALSSASVYIYGPRSDAVPVLATCSTTDPDFIAHDGTCGGTPTQGHSLFAGGTDPQVATDATGFKYQLMDNIGDLASGTYLVRVSVSDYGGVSNDDYRPESTAVMTFQVGTADEEPKVAGNGCLNCHGDTHMHVAGSHAHNAPFDTDYCLACHDLSGNHGDYIGNRVHAIHMETFDADFTAGRNWTEVTYPQDANNCSVCHTNSEAAVPVWRNTEPLACGGCHGSDPLAVDVAQAYIADPDNEVTEDQAAEILAKAEREAGAAGHMLIMMGVPGGDRTDFFTYGSEPVPGCLVCHGAGRDFDLYKLMGLAQFGIPEDTSD